MNTKCRDELTYRVAFVAVGMLLQQQFPGAYRVTDRGEITPVVAGMCKKQPTMYSVAQPQSTTAVHGVLLEYGYTQSCTYG